MRPTIRVETAAKSIITRRIRSLSIPVDPSSEVEAPRTFSFSSSGPPVEGVASADGDGVGVGEEDGDGDGDADGEGEALGLWACTSEPEIKNAIIAIEAIIKRSNL